MKHTLLIPIICAAALAACSDNNSYDSSEFVQPTTAVTNVTTTSQTTTTTKAATTTTVTTTAVTTQPLTLPAEEAPVVTDQHIYDLGKETLRNVFDKEKLRRIDYYVSAEENGSIAMADTEPYYQLLSEYLSGHDLEPLEPDYFGAFWDTSVPTENLPVIIWLVDKDAQSDVPSTANVGVAIYLSGDKRYMAIYSGDSVIPFRLADAEQLQPFYELAQE